MLDLLSGLSFIDSGHSCGRLAIDGVSSRFNLIFHSRGESEEGVVHRGTDWELIGIFPASSSFVFLLYLTVGFATSSVWIVLLKFYSSSTPSPSAHVERRLQVNIHK
jgi:hypothetical protein